MKKDVIISNTRIHILSLSFSFFAKNNVNKSIISFSVEKHERNNPLNQIQYNMKISFVNTNEVKINIR